MGYNTYNSRDFEYHSTTVRGFKSMDEFSKASTQELYRAKGLEEELNPKGVIRECCDSPNHPETIPVILALDVTGSMGEVASAAAKKLGEIMETVYDTTPNVEFLVMAIGDMTYDIAPVQASQFEADIRIAEQLEKIYFEGGGGGNLWESYTAAWYFGLKHTKLDCWKRDKKGIIITMGDESLNPYLPKEGIQRFFGDKVQDDIETPILYDAVREKFEVYHIAINDSGTSYSYHESNIQKTWKPLLKERCFLSSCESLANTIVNIIKSNVDDSSFVVQSSEKEVEAEGISW